MTEAELIDYIISQQAEKIEIKDIQKIALAKGFTVEQFNTAMEAAQLQKQQVADKDIWARITLGPALIIIGCIAFYTDWAGRSIGGASFIGLVTIIPGVRMMISLIKQWMGKKTI